MSGQIEQVNVSYSRDEDRILLRIHSSENAEYRVWMTRRYTQLLFQAIEKILDIQPADLPAESASRKAQAAFDHDNATSQADFETPYNDEAAQYPLGEDGILGYRITVDQKPAPMLHLLPKAGAGISLPAQRTLMHNLYHLLRQAAANANWGLQTGLERFAEGSTSRTVN